MPIAGDGKTVISNYKAAEVIAENVRNPETKALVAAQLAVADQLRLQNQIELTKLSFDEDVKFGWTQEQREEYKMLLNDLIRAVKEQ